MYNSHKKDTLLQCLPPLLCIWDICGGVEKTGSLYLLMNTVNNFSHFLPVKRSGSLRARLGLTVLRSLLVLACTVITSSLKARFKTKTYSYLAVINWIDDLFQNPMIWWRTWSPAWWPRWTAPPASCRCWWWARLASGCSPHSAPEIREENNWH